MAEETRSDSRNAAMIAYRLGLVSTLPHTALVRFSVLSDKLHPKQAHSQDTESGLKPTWREEAARILAKVAETGPNRQDQKDQTTP